LVESSFIFNSAYSFALWQFLFCKIDFGKIALAVNYTHYRHIVFVLDPKEDDIITLSDASESALDFVSLGANTWVLD
jgi:hypothetical protein